MATLTVNRLVPRSAMWYVFQGALVKVLLANTTGAVSPPPLDGPYENWIPYELSSQFDLFYTGGSVNFSSGSPQKTELQQLQFTLNYNQSVTYTDVLVFVIPARAPSPLPSGQGQYAFPFLGVIHESTAVTLANGQIKTYKLDLTAQWL